MATAQSTGGLRAAFAISLAIALASAGLLYQKDIRAPRGPAFSRGGGFSHRGNAAGRNVDLSVPTPSVVPLPSGQSHSEAVLSAPGERSGSSGDTENPFPPLGRYVYDVDGSESAGAFGSRDYPDEMTMDVHRPSDASPPLSRDEVVFDVKFSEDHEEREIVAYRSAGVMFAYEAGSVTFGPGVTRTSEATYDPPMLQVPLPLKVGESVSGKSVATRPDGSTARTEDWTVTVEREETINVLGRDLETWVVKVVRKSEPGSSETVDRTRSYWYYPGGHIWVKWTEDFTGSQQFGPSTFTYTTHYTATLDHFEAL